MDYKAKYEEALKTAKFFADNTDDEICKKKIEAIFPELAESEDEKIRKDIIHFIKGFGLISKKKEKSWLAWLEKQKKLKQSWSEEDEERYLSCLQRLGTGNLEQPETINIVWLKSLKDRITLTNNDDFDKGYDLGISVAKLDQWKPTEEQFKALEMEIYDSGQYLEVRKTLESLYNDLKKL